MTPSFWFFIVRTLWVPEVNTHPRMQPWGGGGFSLLCKYTLSLHQFVAPGASTLGASALGKQNPGCNSLYSPARFWGGDLSCNFSSLWVQGKLLTFSLFSFPCCGKDGRDDIQAFYMMRPKLEDLERMRQGSKSHKLDADSWFWFLVSEEFSAVPYFSYIKQRRLWAYSIRYMLLSHRSG